MVDEEKRTDDVAPDAPVSPDVEGSGPEPAEKRANRKKLYTVIGVVAAVVIVAGAGFAVWHEQPSFCNAICHTPMDAYLPTYEADPQQASTDKWGNEVTKASAMMAPLHRVKAQATCMGCHVPTLGEQIGEGISWATGNYTVYQTPAGQNVVPEKSLAQLTEARELAGEQFCFNDACHELDRQQLAVETRDMARNPHAMPRDANHELEITCGDCHKAHRASVNQCSRCHDDAVIPDGWLDAIDEGRMIREME